jgi:hypothetical protein
MNVPMLDMGIRYDQRIPDTVAFVGMIIAGISVL